MSNDKRYPQIVRCEAALHPSEPFTYHEDALGDLRAVPADATIVEAGVRHVLVLANPDGTWPVPPTPRSLVEFPSMAEYLMYAERWAADFHAALFALAEGVEGEPR